MYEIYKVTNQVNGKIYIGFTTQGYQTRWSKHLKDVESGSSYIFHKSIRKYGKECFTLEFIETCSSLTNMKEREIYWISQYQSNQREFGYNMTDGGDGTVGLELSQERKDNLSVRQGSIKVAVSKYTLDGIFIETFESLNAAARSVTGSVGAISNSIETGGTCYGYKWKKETKVKNNIVKLFDENNDLINSFPSISKFLENFKIKDKKRVYDRISGYNKIFFFDKNFTVIIEDKKKEKYLSTYIYRNEEIDKINIQKAIKASAEKRKTDRSFVTKQQANHPGKKKFLKVDLKGNIVTEYSSQKECIRETGYTVNRIKHAARQMYIIEDHYYIMAEKLESLKINKLGINP